MWLIRAALRRPITILVAVIAVALTAVFAVSRMRADIFPDLDLPVIYVAQPYGGMSPAQMEGYITYYYEYHFLYINGIESVESKSIQNTALLKLTFHPGTDMAEALAQTIGYVNRARAFMPPGTVGPFIMRFDAGTVPVGYLVFTSESRSLGEIQDLALNRVRPQFATLPGLTSPPPFGGSQRTIVIRVDPDRLRSYGMSPDEVIRAVTAGNVIMPSGSVNIGDETRISPMNSVVGTINDLLELPIRTGAGPPVSIRDVGSVSDSTDIPTAYALVNGRRAVYIPVTKRPDASTLTVVQRGEGESRALPGARARRHHGVVRARSVDERLGGAARRAPGSGPRRAADRPDGAAVPARLAQRGDRRRHDSVRAARRGGRAVGRRPDHQHHDARRAGAGGRHPRRRSDGRDREHPHASGARHAGRARGARRERRSGGAATARDALGRRGVRPVVLHDGRVALALRAAVARGRLRDDRVVPAVELARAGAVGVAARKPARLRSGAELHAERLGRRGCAIASGRLLRRLGARARALVAGLRRRDRRDRRGRRPDARAARSSRRAAPSSSSCGSARRPARSSSRPSGWRATCSTRSDRRPVRTTWRSRWDTSASSPRRIRSTRSSSGPADRTKACCRWRSSRMRRFGSRTSRKQLRGVFHEKFPDAQFSFEPGDIVSRIMNFGAPTPVEVAVMGPDFAASRDFAAKVRGRARAGSPRCAICSTARRSTTRRFRST